MTPSGGQAAVAIIKIALPEEKFLILRRAPYPGDPWSGHFSFPGGRKDTSDKNLLFTCIRETEEETGILLRPTQLNRKLSLEPAGRNFRNPLWVQPFIFELATLPSLKLQASEISSAFWLSKKKFSDLSFHLRVEMVPGQKFPAYPVDDYYIWGFTYRLLLKICDLPMF